MTDQQEKVEAAIAGLEAALEREWSPARHKTELRTLLSAYQAQAGEVAKWKKLTANLVRDVLANDFNECWGSFTEAVLALSPPATEGARPNTGEQSL